MFEQLVILSRPLQIPQPRAGNRSEDLTRPLSHLLVTIGQRGDNVPKIPGRALRLTSKSLPVRRMRVTSTWASSSSPGQGDALVLGIPSSEHEIRPDEGVFWLPASLPR